MSERISGVRRLAYSLGAPGYEITDRVVVTVALYYYLPPPDRGLTAQLPPEMLLGFLSVFGIAMIIGRLFDMAADPLVGYASDRSRSRLGRRRVFLAMGIVPVTVVPALLFWPPGPPGSLANSIALVALLAIYFVAFTVYVAPFQALIPELATDAHDRTRLSRLLAIVSFPALGLYGVAWPAGIDLGSGFGLSPEQSVRWVVVLSLTLAFVFCLLPILAVDERRFTRTVSSALSFKQAVLQTVSNRPFLKYLAGYLVFLLGVNLMSPAPVYYATVVLGRSEGFAAILGLALFASALVGFLLVGRVSDAIGPKRSMIACNLIFAAGVSVLWFLRADLPGGPHDRMNLIIILSVFGTMGIAVAGFMVLPYVLISQVIDQDAATHGAHRAAMYFGVQGFLTKGMFGIGALLITFLFLRFGKSPEEPLGVLLIGPIAAVACLISAALFSLYPERQVLAVTEGGSGIRSH
jgi:GPH family glycoside/pentoside/hexuronide:cation symporter